MSIQVDAVYENGVLKPLQPLDLIEHEHVVLNVVKAFDAACPSSLLDVAYIESLRKHLDGAEPAPGLDEVRRRLAKIPGSMTADFIAEREDR